jgi:NhaP-type Na+/H+ or K+/H+ antiporter
MLQLLGLLGIVIILSALASGYFERAGISLVLLFLIVGLLAGPYGVGFVNFELDSPLIQLVAIVSLTMVLFSDAVLVSPAQLRAHVGLAVLVLGPGTLLVASIIAIAAWQLLGFSPAGSAMVGAALASTDMVLLRSVLRNPRVPAPVRQALRLESGMNDAVLVPIILIAIALVTADATSVSFIATVLARLLLLAPAAGILIGLLCVLSLERVRKRFGMRRDYESLYAIGVAFTAFAVGEALHASGYVAAFTAGIAIAIRDVELCDCFHDYGEATAEAALLLTFVALGSSVIWVGLPDIDPVHVLFVLIALAARPLVLLLVLRPARLTPRDLRLIAWFGPRGLNSLLLILLPTFAGVPEARELFAVCSLVVIASVLLHGRSPALLAREGAVKHSLRVDALRITLDQLKELRTRGEQVHILDVRTEGTYHADGRIAEGAMRVNPNHTVKEVLRLGLPRDAWLALYCT